MTVAFVIDDDSREGARGPSYASLMTTKKGGRPLPKALAVRAKQAADLKVAKALASAKKDLALIARRRAQIVESFYDIGEALVRLKNKDVIRALGRRSFAEVCEKDVNMSPAQADRLVDIVTRMTREEAMSVGSTKAAALVGLANATVEDDTPGELLRRRKALVLPSGKKIVPKAASARALAEASAELRAARPATGKRGSRVGDDERDVAAALAKALVKHGIKVVAAAGRPGKASTLRFEGVTLESLAVLGAACAKAAKG